MVVRIVNSLRSKRHAGIEYPFHSFFRQGSRYIHGSQLRRIADSIRGNRLHSLLEHGMAGRIRQHDAEAKLGKHRMPERIILIDIERAWNSHRSVRTLPRSETHNQRHASAYSQNRFGMSFCVQYRFPFHSGFETNFRPSSKVVIVSMHLFSHFPQRAKTALIREAVKLLTG